ncbi:hypothetical protein SRB5_03070 [Streptomyces sp. RB5]|uniref:Uncharacterized protein n=1 Tax=Streptomyces smaragdinus TaxID=2585196 RepID=A0A7K0C9R8_9ACTN|nr:hypothetical protein [Streptomyces smaragdinus]
MLACPQCKGTDQVVKLEPYWRSLGQDAEGKRDLACPPDFKAQWQWPAGCLVGAVLLLSASEILWGLALLVVAAVTTVVIRYRSTQAQEARARWHTSMYCRHCDRPFTPAEGLAS